MTASGWTVVFAAGAVDDLGLIEDHLTRAEALHHAGARIMAIIAASERLAAAPFRGMAHDDLLPGLRQLALDNAAYWFVMDRMSCELRVLAVFFGGQDHRRHMLVRLLRGR